LKIISLREKPPTGVIIGIVLFVASISFVGIVFCVLKWRRHQARRKRLYADAQKIQRVRVLSAGSPITIQADTANAARVNPYAADAENAPTSIRSILRQQLENELRIAQESIVGIQTGDPVTREPRTARRLRVMSTSSISTRGGTRRSRCDLNSQLEISLARNEMLLLRIQELEDQLQALGHSDEPLPGYMA
jgi:hypothetical protein